MSEKRNKAALLVVTGCLAAVGSLAIAQAVKESPKKTDAPEMKLPPGWTEADMQACMLAGTPGEMHERLTKSAGVWQGRTTMWMVPDAEPCLGECTSKIEPIMDGRYLKWEMTGEMPGMGPYHGLGLYGYDNVTKQFVSIWIDNHSTGILQGVGAQSDDGNTITWTYNFHCPMTGKPTVLREVEKFTSADSKTLEMFGTDPKSGREFKMMEIQLTRDTAQARAKN